jgi:UDP-N-acetylglucosamine 2-epimerase (non-hydrolysing)
MMKRIAIIFGTRPEAIKLAPVYRALKARFPHSDIRACSTGQHRQMLEQVLQVFDIPLDFNLNLMEPGQDLTDITGRVLMGLRSIFSDWRPDLVMVHGDTTTTFAASLAAYYQKIPVAHVEAGLRTGNIYSPWPEEINRKLTGAIADLHFAPTANASANLTNEGVKAQDIVVTGNTVIDALQFAVGVLEAQSEPPQELHELLAGLNTSSKIILVTGHRRENFGAGFESICNAIQQLATRQDVEIIYPVHLNPNVQELVNRLLGGISNVHLIAPQDYLPFVYLMRLCYLVLTDSGGVQEEAPSLGKPVLVMRDTTERPEAVTAGTAKLVGTDHVQIVAECTRLLDDPVAYRDMGMAINPYGDGLASDRIASAIEARFDMHGKPVQ